MLDSYIHNPGRPIRKIQHIPVTAAGIFQLPTVGNAGKSIFMSSYRDGGPVELSNPGY